MKKLVIANWKMNPQTLQKAEHLFNLVKRGIKNIKNVEVVICPPFVYLPILGTATLAFSLGGQDCFWEKRGAFTGEISPTMLKDLGCQYVIIGHSERRKYFTETNEMINKKIKAALLVKLKPILCIGETEEERNRGKTFKVLKFQLKEALNHLTAQSLNHLIVAYEPIWAIGTGKPCGIPEAKKANLFIRKTLNQLTNLSTYKLVYGGSVNSKNAASYVKKAGFDGLLIGGASIMAKEFIKIVKDIDKG